MDDPFPFEQEFEWWLAVEGITKANDRENAAIAWRAAVALCRARGVPPGTAGEPLRDPRAAKFHGYVQSWVTYWGPRDGVLEPKSTADLRTERGR